jgi:hypothetical protein
MISFSILVPGVSFFQRTCLSVPLVKLEKIRPLAILKKNYPKITKFSVKNFYLLKTLNSVILR